MNRPHSWFNISKKQHEQLHALAKAREQERIEAAKVKQPVKVKRSKKVATS